ncbi:nicotinate-nucleotide pyrophosphorylase (carboxylating) [Lipingzhangella halophila]|uniref:L-aspartate oxidase n=1 Tax=Lipingzhangella halophila TaxID=1783352 RepID=A0A7W7RC96_9ACTN|nr:L-aspartate oxidase [Lipingzhangella halophila]MBB4929259.1 nicotinate-nucleotide pyrophosphorylase (carboxylating) [Lipingzhangella halophila]
MSETTTALPSRLAAPEPGWAVDTDVVVVGSGIAGLSAALRYTQYDPRGRVVLVTKDTISNGSTRWAQGGIAAAIDPSDAPLSHMVDTMAAGAGMCDAEAVRTLVNEGPDALRWLVDLGTAFDRADDGALALTREGGHRAARIAHAGGDATGAEIERALIAAVRAEPRIEVIEHAFAPDLLLGPNPEYATRGAPAELPHAVCGVTVHVMGEGQRDGVGAVRAMAVVLATGGMGQVFAATTNPAVSTGDGLALALRAGARVRDLEFVQFHPTVLWLGPEARGQQPLISEAVRGEGAFLVDSSGRRFMEGEHELADLAPRDVVAKAIARAMESTGSPHVFLDARHFGSDTWRTRFPTILASCVEHGIDPVRDLIPVAPAAHYASGGVEVDLHGQTELRGLYAVGEVARTGVHGANRLASNSLLEGVVFADRIARTIAEAPPARTRPAEFDACAEPGLVDPAIVPELRALMSRHVGVLRDGEGLAAATGRLAELAGRAGASVEPGVAAWEASNMLTVGAVLTRAATERAETRGSHWRADHPEPAAGRRERVSVELRRGRLSSTRIPHYGRASLRSGPAIAVLGDEIGVPAARAVVEALHEDVAFGPGQRPLPLGAGVDITSVATIPASQIRTGHIVARADGVVAGLPVAEEALWRVAEGIVEVRRDAVDGDEVKRGDALLTVTGRTRDLLTAERTALNFLTHLSGIATATRSWVDAVSGTGARIRDTRKTHAGLRTLEKYAVRCGGGVNHRFGLGDAALIKDNHVVAAGGVAEAVRAVRAAYPDVPLEVEVDRLDQIEPALAAGAGEILLDNFTVAELREAVALVAGRARLEASGGLTRTTAPQVAATGVDYLAVGALTHSSPALDIAFDLRV